MLSLYCQTKITPHMCKVNHFPVQNKEKTDRIHLPSIKKKQIEADVSGMSLSSFGGIALLRNEESRLGLSRQIASCINDTRRDYLVRHPLHEILMTRIFQICMGYEDVNDCDRTRKDPMMCLGVAGDIDSELCSSATMCRFENMVTEDDLLAIQELFLHLFIQSYEGKAPGHIILDCDDTNVDTYGGQQLTLFNSYYDSYCYMPLLIFEGHSGKMILPLLRPGRRNKTANIADTLVWVIEVLREAWPETVIMVRGDSHFCSHEFMDWASDPGHRRVLFITGLSANNRLLSENVTKELLTEAWHDYNLYGMPVRKYGHFYYKAGSWLFPQKVVVKAEITAKGEQNVRFIVSNIRSVDDSGLYETTYCGRGKDELYIRQFKEAVNGDRLSCHTFNANRLRIFIHAAAYILLHSIRERALRGTELENANLLTIRERLLLTAVCVRASRRKVILDYPRHNPMRIVLRQALLFYGQLRA